LTNAETKTEEPNTTSSGITSPHLHQPPQPLKPPSAKPFPTLSAPRNKPLNRHTHTQNTKKQQKTTKNCQTQTRQNKTTAHD
jgi:hypothetical protein